MDDQRIGWTLRSIRVGKRWRQEDLAARAKVSRWVVMRIEQGRIASMPFGKLRAVATALDARIDAVIRWQGGDLSRLVSARHARMHEVLARYFQSLPGWIIEPEVSFSIYGERGIIDILAWHPTSRILLVIELKTEIVDVNEMLGALDRKRRLAATIAAERKLNPVAIATWVVVADSSDQPPRGGRSRNRAASEAAIGRAQVAGVAAPTAWPSRWAQFPATCARHTRWRRSGASSSGGETSLGSQATRIERGLS